MEKKEFQKLLLDKIANNTASLEELEVFDHLVKSGEIDEDLAAHMQATWDEASSGSVKKLHFGKLYKMASVAAACIILFVTGWYFINKEKSSSPVNIAQNKPINIKAGGNKATLKLANGKLIVLNEAKPGVKIDTSVLSYSDGSIVEKLSDNSTTAMNELETPRGGFYKIALADGTIAWLNASSRIQFPASFKNMPERKVSVSGEVYFEVTKNPKQPFVVAYAEQELKVLGTHFNINCYPGETNKTTLLEGSVQIKLSSIANNQRPVILHPGEQLSDTNGQYEVTKVDANDAIAWKNGYFVFNDESLEDIMNEISRWYDVDIEFKNEMIKNIPFSGSVTRFADLSELLKTLELTQKVKFTITNKKIIVDKF